jgi:hypothetical protein
LLYAILNPNFTIFICYWTEEWFLLVVKTFNICYWTDEWFLLVVKIST